LTRIYTPTSGPGDWRRLLADPAKHWKRKRSAFELAVSWERARRSERGLPSAVAALFDRHPKFKGASLVLGIPEHQVSLDGGGHPSQTDLWALLSIAGGGLVSVAIEAKAGEPFDKTVAEWLAAGSPRSGRPARLRQLQEVLALKPEVAPQLRYQLLHRTAAAMLEARRFRAGSALLLVQAFADDPESLEAFSHFGRALGCVCSAGTIVDGPVLDGVALHVGWLQCPPATDAEVAAANRDQ